MQRADGGGLPKFRVFETAEFLKNLDRLQAPDFPALRKKLDAYVYPQLREEPFFGPNIKKLRGYSPDTWRYRIGKFRLFYTIARSERVVFLLAIDRRKEAYR